ncbi:hypothetical protein H0H87_012169 [Tephrocybe sp. NHM501043]|nr:hypothetical protein H0H87_012169 [Tephrocybe sp. NHM501043]
MFDFPEPPTEPSLADARRVLSETRSSVSEVDAKIDAAEATLAQVVRESQLLINELQTQRDALERTISHTMAYLSPIRRLPVELLRNIFMECFDKHPCCAWVLAAVCGSWRRLVLRMPKLWSKIRLLTTQNSSADTIRLWLERSGDTVPLDIEIFLRVTSPNLGSESPSRRRRRSFSRSPSPPPWLPFPHQGVTAHHVVYHPPPIPIVPINFGPSFVPTNPPIVVPQSPTAATHDPWLPMHQLSDRPSRPSRSSLHWGHIAIYYLAEQMHRWKRFVFRFDKQFASMSALKSISGDAPLLREFEVTSAEAAYYQDWSWLPNAPPNASLVLPSLETLTLQFTPFKWSSPMLRTNLRTLNLRALPTAQLPLDRILYIVSNNPALEFLTLHFQSVLPAVLPLSPTSLTYLKNLHLGGHHTLSQLIDVLILPELHELALDIEAREPIEESITSLLTRSSKPALSHLSIGHGSSPNSQAFYYGSSGASIAWATLLPELPDLESLHVGGTPLEPLLLALGEEPPVCPELEVLSMRNCHGHSDGVGKLVAMVETRNPPLGAGTGVQAKRLRSLEVYDCASIGEDVVDWLGSRVDEVVCTDADYER